MVYQPYKTLRAFAIILLASVMLVACSHSDEALYEPSKEEISETIDLTSGANVERMRKIVEGRRDVMNLSVLSNNISDGRVQVYDPVSGVNDVADGTAVYDTADMGAVPANEYVMIYPLDGVASPAAVGRVPTMQGADYISVAVDDGRSLKVHFDHNSALIRPSSSGTLDSLAESAKQNVGGVSVEGHASRYNMSGDATRRIMGNLKISMKRAYNVAQELVRRGVPADSIRLVGWGETRLPATGADGENARRVEVLPF